MADLGQVFDAAQHDKSTDLLPPGSYHVQIVKSEMKSTSKGGQQLVLEMAIMDGPHQGRRCWDRLNLLCPTSSISQEIAQKTMNAICAATNSHAVSESEQVHHKSMVASVVVRPAEGEYGPSNAIKKYGPYAQATHQTRPVTVTSQPQVAPLAQSAPSGAVPPWRKAATAA